MMKDTCVLRGDCQNESVDEGLVKEGTDSSCEVIENGLVFFFPEHHAEVVRHAED